MKKGSGRFAPFVVQTLITLAVFSQAVQCATITLWNSNVNSGTQEWYQTVFKPVFEAAHPGVTLEMSFPSTGTFYDKLLVAIAAGVAPDVVTSNNPLFYTEGLVIDLSKQIETWRLAKEIYPPILHMLQYQGHIYGIPLAIAPRTLVVNKRILREGGYDGNNPPYTWNTIAPAVSRLTRWNADRTTIEQSGMQTELSDVGAAHGFIYSNGGEIVNRDGTSAFNSEAAIEAIGFWSQLFRQNLPSGIKQPTFVQGKSAMIAYNNPSVFKSIANTNPDLLDDIAVAPAPITQKRAGVLLFGAPLGITRDSQKKELAWELLTFHFQPELISKYNQLQGYIPSTRSGLLKDVLHESPWIEGYLSLAERFGIPTWSFESPVFQLVRGFLDKAAALAYKGDVSPKQALDDAARQWNQVVKENSK